MTASSTACIWLKSCQPELLPAGPGWSARSTMRVGGGLQAHQTGLLDFNTFSLFWRPEFETVSHWSQVWNLEVDPWRMFRWGCVPSPTLRNSTKSLSPEQRHLDVQACSLTALRQEFQGCLVCFADSTSGFVANVASEKDFPPFVTIYSTALRRSNGSPVGSPAEVRACEMSLSDPW